MPQLHMYVPENVAERVRQKAEKEGKSTSQILADVIKREFGGGWPEDFVERYTGFWKGAPIEIEELPLEELDFAVEARTESTTSL